MPELPEVETIKLFLANKIPGLKVIKVEILNPKSFIGDYKLILDKEIKSIERRAKVLRIQFEDNELLIHLKMSGQLIWEKNYESRIKGGGFAGGHPTKDMNLEMPNKSTRVIFCLSDGSKLFFNDQRKFGWIRLMDHDSSIMGHDFFAKVGPEPLEDGFTWQILKKRLLARKKTAIKIALLNQEVVAGVGNIYACEACFIAGIDPRKKVSDLEERDFRSLYEGIITSLITGIKYGGSTRSHFIDPSGKKGQFLDYAFVYARENKECRHCGEVIKKIKLGGRGTYYCENCQK